MKEERPEHILSFSSAAQWRSWLLKNHADSNGVWLQFYKKASGKKNFAYAEALDEALCFGWIDSQVKTHDADSYKQKFTPRRRKSIWSKRNKVHVARLIKEKRMTKAGLTEVEAAKKDGRWDNAYDSPSTMSLPADFLKELKRDREAYAFFKTLNKANTYAIAWRLQTAKKPETRAARIEKLLAMLKRGEKLH